jgi:hypothetical protein
MVLKMVIVAFWVMTLWQDHPFIAGLGTEVTTAVA